MNNAGELFDAFRSDVVDTAKPYLWTDDEVVRYADDAYWMFTRFTGGISDISSDATSISLSTGTDSYDLHPSILRIMDATLASDGSAIEVINGTDLPNLFSNATDYGQLRTLSRNNTPGVVRWLLTGQQRDKCKVIQIPVVDDTLYLSIYRTPLAHITDESHDLGEVDEDHHLHLLLWMKHLAYMKQDAETFDKTKSADMEQAFRNYCLQVKAEWGRYKHKTRVVAYGGI